MTIGRRGFLKGVVTLPAVAAVGAQERFLVGRYGVPDGLAPQFTADGGVTGELLGLDLGVMAAGAMMLVSLFEKQVKVQEKLTAEATKLMMPTLYKMLPEANGL